MRRAELEARRRERWERRPVQVPQTPVLEPCPPEQAGEDFPEYGGTVGFTSEGVAFCAACGWRGVATTVGGVVLTWCPQCQHEPDTLPAKAVRVPRNVPCPCGSGRKAKKCECVEFTV